MVGLSTAIRIQEKSGYRVTIVAQTFPTDPRTIHYTSHWAVSTGVISEVTLINWDEQGAHHVSHAFGDKRQLGDCFF